MQVCTSLQTANHASTPPLNFLQAGCPSCHPTNSVKAQREGTFKDPQKLLKFDKNVVFLPALIYIFLSFGIDD